MYFIIEQGMPVQHYCSDCNTSQTHLNQILEVVWMPSKSHAGVFDQGGRQNWRPPV